MVNHPNRSRRHKGCTMTRTAIICANNNRPLYAITGRLEKREGLRPFLTSIRDCKAWIDAQDLAREVV